MTRDSEADRRLSWLGILLRAYTLASAEAATPTVRDRCLAYDP